MMTTKNLQSVFEDGSFSITPDAPTVNVVAAQTPFEKALSNQVSGRQPEPVSVLSLDLSKASPELLKLLEDLKAAEPKQKKALIASLKRKPALLDEYQQYLRAVMKVGAAEFKQVNQVGGQQIGAIVSATSEMVGNITKSTRPQHRPSQMPPAR